MNGDEQAAVKVLNGLIETALDSAHGYHEAAGSARDGRLKTMFVERSRRRQDLAQRLQQEVRTFGGRPAEHASLTAKAQRRLLDLKDALLGGRSETAVIDEVERGEDLIKARFEQALEQAQLPANARQAVSHAYESIRADHDEISRLKHALH